MPIVIQIVDGGAGSIIEARGTVREKELVDTLHRFFAADEEQFRQLKYILFDYSALMQMDVTDDTVDVIARLCAEAYKSHPDPVVAIATYFSMTVNLEQIKRLTRFYELFVHGARWESLLFRTKMEAVRWLRKKVSTKFGLDDLTFS